MPKHFPWLVSELDKLRQKNLVRIRRSVTPLANGWCSIKGRKLRNFASNDYLNLAHDRRVIEAARNVLESAGVGSGASAMVTGRTKWHAQLETRLAQFEGHPATVLFPTGYAANVGTIGSLIGSADVVFCDRLNHASLVDGCRLSEATFRVYRHDNLIRLERELSNSSEYGRRLIVTDSIFSMDGDIAPLKELCDLADRYDATVLVDEAHATGVFGPRGRGVAEWLHVEDRVAVRIGTLGKAIGSLGGFVTGSKHLIDWLWQRARTQMYSTALPPSVCAAACAAVDIIEAEPERRQQLLELADTLRIELARSNILVAPNSVGPIVPVIIGDPDATLTAADMLEQQGFLVAAIRPPTVSAGTSRLRVTLNCAHTKNDVNQLLEALSQILAPIRT